MEYYCLLLNDQLRLGASNSVIVERGEGGSLFALNEARACSHASRVAVDQRQARDGDDGFYRSEVVSMPPNALLMQWKFDVQCDNSESSRLREKVEGVCRIDMGQIGRSHKHDHEQCQCRGNSSAGSIDHALEMRQDSPD